MIIEGKYCGVTIGLDTLRLQTTVRMVTNRRQKKKRKRKWQNLRKSAFPNFLITHSS